MEVTQQGVINLIKHMSGQANVITMPRLFIDMTGDHIQAIVLSQILYWSERTKDPDGWFYKSGKEWKEELGLSNYQITRAVGALKEMGVETDLRKAASGAPTTHYRLNNDVFSKWIFEFLKNGKSRNSKMNFVVSGKSSDAETTAEPTSEPTATEASNKQQQQPYNAGLSSDERATAAAGVKRGLERVGDRPAPRPPSEADAALVAELTAAGLNRDVARRFAAASPEECRRQLDHMPFVRFGEGGFLGGRGKWLRLAIEQGFGPPDGYEAAQAKRQERERQAQRRQLSAEAEAREQAEKERKSREFWQRLEAIKADPEQWAALRQEAVQGLPPPLRARFGEGKEPGEAAQRALDGQIRKIVTVRSGTDEKRDMAGHTAEIGEGVPA